jgi:type IV pilus assembly protein PilW
MRLRHTKPANHRSQSGFSLVELMVAVVIGLVLTSGIVEIYLSTKSGYNMQDGLSRLQENARFAFDFLSRDLRMAGESGGCRNLSEIEPNVIAENYTVDFGEGNYIQGYDSGSGWSNPTSLTRVGNSDVLVVRRAAVADTQLTGNMTAVNANIQITNNPLAFKAGEILIISDCETADVFAASGVSTGNITIAHASNVNTANFLSKAYDQTARLMRFEQTTYFLANNPDGNPSLYKVDLYGNANEIVTGIEDMQVEYGVDSSGDLRVDEYKGAGAMTSADWDGVVSVKVNLLARTNNEVSPTESGYKYNFSTVSNPGDRRLRRWFSATVTLRNIAL